MKQTARALILLATLLALIYHVRNAINEWHGYRSRFSLAPGLAAAASLLYLLGLATQGTPWLLSLKAFGADLPLRVALPTYLISHLAKYVPGKAMVLLLRLSLLSGRSASPAVVAGASFYETFATMAAGSLLAAVVALTCFPGAAKLQLLSAAILAAGFGVAAEPHGFRLLGLLASRAIPAARAFVDRMLPMSSYVFGQAAGLLAWSLISMSYLCCVLAVGVSADWNTLVPVALLATPLATVGGFVSLAPGQLGVREWVLIAVVAPALGSELFAVAAAVLFRLVTLGTEAVVAGTLYAVLIRGGRI